MPTTLRHVGLAAAVLLLGAATAPAPAADLAAGPAQSAAVPAAPIPAARHDGFDLSYDVYRSGFHVLSLDFELALDGSHYRSDAQLRSAGIVAWLFDWRLEAASAGLLAADSVAPLSHRRANHWRGSVRSVAIDYRAGVPAAVRAEPPYGDEVARAVSPDMLVGTVDPVSAVTALVLENAHGPLCRPHTAVYDGRRRYDAELAPLGQRQLTASVYAPFTGTAEGCRLTFERIAGFKDGDDRMSRIAVDIWLADIGAGGVKVPVRLELETPWGTGLAHLIRARRSDGAPLFGDPKN